MNEAQLALIIWDIQTRIGSSITTQTLATELLKELKRKGYYINKTKGDPSGRW